MPILNDVQFDKLVGWSNAHKGASFKVTRRIDTYAAGTDEREACQFITDSKIGKTAGQVPGFKYSDANKNSGIVWTEEKLFEYLKNPRAVIPGTTMAFAGIADPQKRADVIAFIKANGQV